MFIYYFFKMNSITDLEILNIKSIDNKYKDSEDDDSDDNSININGDGDDDGDDDDSINGNDDDEDEEISDFESDNNYDTKLKVKDEEQEEESEEELGELEDYETDIDSNEPYSEYSDSDLEEDNDIQELEDSLLDTELNEQNDSESESEMNEDKIIKEIFYLQNTTHNLIPRKQFKLLCYEVLQDFAVDHYFSTDAIDAIQTASEAYMIEVFQKSNEISINGKRKTIQPKDMNFAKRYRTEYE